MNKVFKVIWNHATQTWTAVSELGHAKGKTKSKKIVKLTALAGAVLTSLGVSQVAQASVDLGNSAVNISPNGTYNGSNRVGKDSIVVGYQNTANNEWGTTALGANNTAIANAALAVGNNNQATGGASTAMGVSSIASGEASVAIGNVAQATQIRATAVGNRATATQDSASAFGNRANASAQFATAIGDNSHANAAAVAVGTHANAEKQDSIAIGNNAHGAWTNAIAVGKDSVASQDHAIATGTSANASGVQAVGVGSYTKAEGNLTVAVGPYAQANKEAAIAVGSNATATETNSVAVGQTATASKNNAIAIGTKTKADGDNAVGIGAYTESNGTRSTAVGVLSQANGAGSFAGGASAQATGANSVAIGGAQDGTLGNKAGTAAKATGDNAVSIGTNATASIKDSVALGSNSTTSNFVPTNEATVGSLTYSGFAGNTSALGNGAVVSVGTAGSERQIQNVAAGRLTKTSTDAVNGSQLYTVANDLDDKINNHHWVVSGNSTVNAQPKESNVYHKDVVEFQNGKGTTATVVNTPANKSLGQAGKTVVQYNANIVNGENTEVVYNADGSVKINAKVSGGTDTTAAVTTGTTDALAVTNSTTGNVTTYNVDAKTGSISTTPVGAATYAKDGDKATGGNYGARLTNVSTVTDIVNNVSWHLNSSAVDGGKITEGSDTEPADVKASNTVNINAGKNIEIKRNGTTIEISSTAGAKGDTGATGAKGDTGATGAAGKDGKNAEAKIVDNNNGTHTVTIVDGNGQTTSTIVKDGATGAAGKDGKNAEAKVVDNNNGTHTVTIVDGNGQTTSTIVKDGATGAKGDTGAKGEDGTSITGEVVDNGDGTHTITITDLGTGSVTTTIVKDGKDGATGATGATGADGKNAEADVKDNGDGTHTVTIKDGNGNTTTTIVKNGKNGKDGKDGVMTWDIKSTGHTTPASETNAKTIKHTNTVNMEAGKNLTVEQSSNNDSATVKFALDSNVTNLDKVVVNGKDGVDGKDGVTITAPGGKDGNDGLDGKVGISGKDGKDAVSISGKDGVGQIGLTGPKGKDGKDGASINITTDNGKQTLVNREVGADGKPGKTTQRIIYVPTDKDGNPLKDENGNTIKREVATMDDGLIFGGNTGEAHKAALGTQVNVKGATTNTDWNKFDAGKNIMTQVNGDTITVGLAKDLEVDNVDVNNNVTAKGTISAPTFKAGDTTIKNGVVTNLTHHIDNPTTVVDDKVLNITDEKKKEAATVRDVLNSGWNLQANGKPVDAVTHGNNVNFASDKGTVTVKANSDGKTSVVNLDVNVDNDTITVNNKGQLVANGTTNFNVATKDGGNKVAKKGGSSTAKITSGKTITYTAGKNIAIEQNGGEILVSTTNDVNHNSVTTNDLTVNKGGNIDMGGNQIHNVKAGTKDTDAVNVSQLKQSIGDVHKRINKVGKEARGGIAGANAAAGLPQVYIPGKSMVAASAGTFKGESAVAVGYSRSSDNGKVIFKLQGNANTQGDVGGSVGVGYQW